MTRDLRPSTRDLSIKPAVCSRFYEWKRYTCGLLNLRSCYSFSYTAQGIKEGRSLILRPKLVDNHTHDFCCSFCDYGLLIYLITWRPYLSIAIDPRLPALLDLLKRSGFRETILRSLPYWVYFFYQYARGLGIIKIALVMIRIFVSCCLGSCSKCT